MVFSNLFKSEDGSTVELSVPESFIITADAAIPEPSTYATIFDAIALGFVAYRN